MTTSSEVLKLGNVYAATIVSDDGGSTYYFTEDLLKKQIVIERIVNLGENDQLVTELTLFCRSSDDSFVIELYNGDYINSFMILGMINPVIAMVEECPTLDEFLDAITRISENYTSALMQENPEKQLEIVDWVNSIFEDLKNISL